MAENVAREKGIKKKYPMDGGEDLLSDSHNFPCQADSTAHVCMDAISQESISRYFDLLESILKEHQLEDYSGVKKQVVNSTEFTLN